MNKLTSLTLALLVPVVALGLGSASAAETDSITQTEWSKKPIDSFYSDDLIGTSLTSRVGEKEIGEINELIINKNGQIVAAIVDVGGFLGMGQKSVAIDWQAMDHTVDMDGHHVLHVNATEQTLKNTPEYQRD